MIATAGRLRPSAGSGDVEVVTALTLLVDLTGVGRIVAAAVLTAWSHPGRCRDDAAFAMLAGTAPIPASSGETVHDRLNRSGTDSSTVAGSAPATRADAASPATTSADSSAVESARTAPADR